MTEGKLKAYQCSRQQQGSIAPGATKYWHPNQGRSPQVPASRASSPKQRRMDKKRREGTFRRCIFLRSLPQVSDVTHQENSHLEEFIIRVAKIPENSMKELGTKGEVGTKSESY